MAVNQSIKALKGYLDKTYKESETKKYISWSSLESEFIERIPTGSLLLDDVFGGGFIRSGLYQFFGGEGGGKSTVVSFIAAAYQQKGLPVLYIDAENRIDKYSAGVPEKFSTTFPDKQVHINKVITNTELDKVYAWDKDNSKVYILGKDGAYLAQVQSSIFKDGTDLTVFEGNAYVLKHEKMYEVSVE